MQQTVYVLIGCSLISAGAALWVDLVEPFLVQPHAWVYSAMLLALAVCRCELAAVCAAALTVLLYYPLVAFAADHQPAGFSLPEPYVFAVAVAANSAALLAACWLAAGVLLGYVRQTPSKATTAEASV